MNRALVVKELRELLAVSALAALAIAWSLGTMWGASFLPWAAGQAVELPFIQDLISTAVFMIGWPLAVGLAMKQTQWEDSKGTFYFLLHRPMPRRRTFLLKIAVGLCLVSATMAAMILLHALWAAQPGHHASPFFWSMTVDAWHAWFTLPLIYAAAFLSGIRPGRWFGSKLLPLVGGGIVAAILATQPWPWIAAVVSAAATAALVACALFVAETRDY